MAPINGEARYVIDPAASQFAVQAFASGLGAAVSHSPKIAIRSWTGEIKMAADAPGKSSLQVRVKAGALEVLDEMRESDRREIHRIMKSEVLETDQFPEIVYESAEVKIEQQKKICTAFFWAGRWACTAFPTITSLPLKSRLVLTRCAPTVIFRCGRPTTTFASRQLPGARCDCRTS